MSATSCLMLRKYRPSSLTGRSFRIQCGPALIQIRRRSVRLLTHPNLLLPQLTCSWYQVARQEYLNKTGTSALSLSQSRLTLQVEPGKPLPVENYEFPLGTDKIDDASFMQLGQCTRHSFEG